MSSTDLSSSADSLLDRESTAGAVTSHHGKGVQNY